MMGDFATDQPGQSSSITVNLPARHISGSRRLAAMQLVGGGLLILIEATGLGIGINRSDSMSGIGGGIWSGILFIFVGSVGLYATREPTVNVDRKRSFTGYLILSIFGSVLACIMFSYSFGSLIVPNLGRYCPEHDCEIRYQYANSLMAVRIASLLLHFALFIAFIISAVFSGYNACGSGPRLVSRQNIFYHTINAYKEHEQTAQRYGRPSPADDMEQTGVYVLPVMDNDETRKLLP